MIYDISYIDSLSQHYADINSIIDDQWFTKMSEFQFKCDKMSFSRISQRIKVLVRSLSFSSFQNDYKFIFENVATKGLQMVI